MDENNIPHWLKLQNKSLFKAHTQHRIPIDGIIC